MKLSIQLLKGYDDIIEPEREDLKIFSIIFKNLEGEYASVEIITPSQYFDCDKICLSYGGKPFFKGKFLKNPEPINTHFIKLFYIAKKEDYTYLNNQENVFKNTVFSDFVLPTIHPVTHEKSFIDYFIENNKVSTDLTSLILSDSFSVEVIHKPIKKLCLKLVAKWVQNCTGIFDIFPFIKRAFPDGNIETLTGINFKSSFPNIGENLGDNFQQSGYTVLYANLQTSSVQNYFLNAEKEKIQIPHYTFKGKLFIEWTIFFKRAEKVEYFIQYNQHAGIFSLARDDQDCDESLSLIVNEEMIDREGGCFFNTMIGKKSSKLALFQACYKIMRSQFTTLVHIKVPFSEAIHLQCGDLVSILHDEKKFEGLISSIQHTLSYATAETKISFFPHPFMMKKIDLERFIEETLNQMATIMQKEADFFHNLKESSTQDFIEKISVFNAAKEQKNILERLDLKDLQKVRECLKKHPTVVNVQFKDLRNGTIKEKKIQIIKENIDATEESDEQPFSKK